MANRIQELLEAGQSVWLDNIRRGLITSGELRRMVEDGWIRGVTSNPTIFQKAIAGSHDYDAPFEKIAGTSLREPQGERRRGYEAYLQVCGEDIQMTADVLRPVYDASD